MWQSYELPKNAEIDGKILEMRTDYRVILDILNVLNDPELPIQEQITCALMIFYPQYDKIGNFDKAVDTMNLFINGNKEESATAPCNKLVDWQQDISIIIPPINRALGKEVRSLPYLHWWTFLGAFMEIGECTFNTFVGIRAKKAQGKKLEKWEQEIYRKNKSEIDIKQPINDETQKLLDAVLQTPR